MAVYSNFDDEYNLPAQYIAINIIIFFRISNKGLQSIDSSDRIRLKLFQTVAFANSLQNLPEDLLVDPAFTISFIPYRNPPALWPAISNAPGRT